jgi:splicing factor U2AF subunit
MPQGMMPVPMMMIPSPMFAPTNACGNFAMPNAASISAKSNLTNAADKVNRELFVGNTPSDISEAVLIEFLNGAMERIKLCERGRKPIIKCRVSGKYAFIECESVEDTNRALNLNGICFRGVSLRISRPSKYVGPSTPCKTWQELTGHHLRNPPTPTNYSSNDDKVNRELFIGNTNSEMTESGLVKFLGESMAYVELTEQPGNPIVSCQMNEKFAFVEFRSASEASAALNLNNIPFMGSHLRVKRPSKYTGPAVAYETWEEVLSKYMVRKLKSASKEEVCKPKKTRIVQLKNMLTMDDLESDEDYSEVMEETREECGEFGHLKKIVIPRRGVGATKIFLEYETIEDAAKAIKALAGRTFDGRTIDAAYMDEVKYLNNDYSD